MARTVRCRHGHSAGPPEGELFLLSDTHRASFDSRYFGPHCRVCRARRGTAAVDMGRAMIQGDFMHSDMRRRCAAPASDTLPAMRPRMNRPCANHSCMRRRTAAEAEFRPHSDVQEPRHERAAPAAHAWHCRLLCIRCVAGGTPEPGANTGGAGRRAR